VQNSVPPPDSTAVVSVEHQVAERAVAGRRDQYAAEVRKLIDAAFVVMRRTGSIDPQVREIVQAAGLSNQAFYRHFASKDALLLTVLADGRRQLVAYLHARLRGTDDPDEQLARFVDGVMAQARDAAAAEATRPFAINGNRLAAEFPDQVAASRAELIDLLRPAVAALGGNDGDVELVHDLTMARMNTALVERRIPDRREVQELVQFCRAGIGATRIGGTHGA
jgi:AcrR family transcriptional regulator